MVWTRVFYFQAFFLTLYGSSFCRGAFSAFCGHLLKDLKRIRKRPAYEEAPLSTNGCFQCLKISFPLLFGKEWEKRGNWGFFSRCLISYGLAIFGFSEKNATCISLPMLYRAKSVSFRSKQRRKWGYLRKRGDSQNRDRPARG